MHSLLARRLPITKFEILDYWLDIGRLDDYESAQKEFDDFSASAPDGV